MTGAALCVGWEAAPVDRIWYQNRQGYWSLLCAQLSLSLTQALFCIDDLSWAFSFAKNVQPVTVLASGPDINFYFMATWNLLCCAWEIAIAPLTSFFLASFPGLSWMGFLYTQASYILEKTYVSNLPCTIKADGFLYRKCFTGWNFLCLHRNLIKLNFGSSLIIPKKVRESLSNTHISL